MLWLQGFLQFSVRGETARLDVDELNERMAVKGRLRLRHSMKPDEGYGMVFAFDGIICHTHRLKEAAWQAVAEERGAPHRLLLAGRWPGAHLRRLARRSLTCTLGVRELLLLTFSGVCMQASMHTLALDPIAPSSL